MTLRINESESSEAALRRLALEGIDEALKALDEKDGRDVTIHTVRKQCKQLRALLRLFREGMGEQCGREMRFFRDFGRGLSTARDDSVTLDVHASLIDRFGARLYASVGAEVRQQLIACQQAAMSRSGRYAPDNDSLRTQLLSARTRSRRWRLDASVEGILERGLLQSYRRARRSLKHALETGSSEDLHELRKHAKSFWYQLEFVARRWPDFVLKRTAHLRKLTQLLGDNQDLVTYCRAIKNAAGTGSPEAVEILEALAEDRRRAIAAEALELAETVFSDRPSTVKAELSERENLRLAAG